MKAVAQRVVRCSVGTDESGEVSSIGKGLLILVGVEKEDTEQTVQELAAKVLRAKMFPSNKREFAFSLPEIGGEAMIVSQVTLCGDFAESGRVSFDRSANRADAEKFCTMFCKACREAGVPVKTGTFGSHMLVELVNDGPVTYCFSS